mmetsp:Transcript_46147/g.73333  ORF Transcript_46147/g.73333 Transcript_46147/m.73333 type:complete len:234 (-) Transcript_46147:448-1149(-)
MNHHHSMQICQGGASLTQQWQQHGRLSTWRITPPGRSGTMKKFEQGATANKFSEDAQCRRHSAHGHERNYIRMSQLTQHPYLILKLGLQFFCQNGVEYLLQGTGRTLPSSMMHRSKASLSNHAAHLHLFQRKLWQTIVMCRVHLRLSKALRQPLNLLLQSLQLSWIIASRCPIQASIHTRSGPTTGLIGLVSLLDVWRWPGTWQLDIFHTGLLVVLQPQWTGILHRWGRHLWA